MGRVSRSREANSKYKIYLKRRSHPQLAARGVSATNKSLSRALEARNFAYSCLHTKYTCNTGQTKSDLVIHRADSGSLLLLNQIYCPTAVSASSATSTRQAAVSEVKAVPLPDTSYGTRTFRGTGQTRHSRVDKQSAHAHENPQRGAAGQPHNNDVRPDDFWSACALAEAEGAHADQKSHVRNPVAACELGIQARDSTNNPDRKV